MSPATRLCPAVHLVPAQLTPARVWRVHEPSSLTKAIALATRWRSSAGDDAVRARMHDSWVTGNIRCPTEEMPWLRGDS